MSPARIVAVTRLVLDVLEDLDGLDIDQMSEAEAEFAVMFVGAVHQLRSVHATAVAEMNSLAPALLAEAYPAPG